MICVGSNLGSMMGATWQTTPLWIENVHTADNIRPLCRPAIQPTRFQSTMTRAFWGRRWLFACKCCLCQQKCRQMQLTFHHYTRKDTNSQNSCGGFKAGTQLQVYPLLQESRARPLPDYIPQVIEQDYTEACRIRDLSPKASATLARRCLQGMIRDFCGISKKRLVLRRNRRSWRSGSCRKSAARGYFQADTLEAIDHVRKLG